MSRLIIINDELFREALERTKNEYIKERIEYEKPRKMTDKVNINGIVKIIYKDRVNTFIFDENDDDITFEDVLMKFNFQSIDDVIYLWIERGLDGEIWRYDDKWYFHARTKGYA